MTDRLRARFRPTIVGAATFILPLILLRNGLDATEAPAMIVGIGLPSLVVISAIFVGLASPSVLRSFASSPLGVSALPSVATLGKTISLEIDPPRPGFLLGVRLSACWNLKFGPFRLCIQAPLPIRGAGFAEASFPRRGNWTGFYSLRASDPFGFVVLDCYGGPSKEVSVPPSPRGEVIHGLIGRSSAEMATAPRLKDDADEKFERRTYVPGDDTRRLDWKHFARSGDLLVRVGEDGIPSRGRVWLLVAVEPLIKKRLIDRLDRCLEAADSLVRRLWDDNQDVMALLPGEVAWMDAGVGSDGAEWNSRMARSLPTEGPVLTDPGVGEHVWTVIYPGDTAGLKRAIDLHEAGCRVVIGMPSKPGSPEPVVIWKRDGASLSDGIFGYLESKLYESRAAKTESAAQRAGIDVRRI